MKEMNRRPGFQIMLQLIGLIRPLLVPMFLAIAFGVLGFLCAIFIPILATVAITQPWMETTGIFAFFAQHAHAIVLWMIALAILRGVLHYIEQYCNHLIAFKLLALIRQKVYRALRMLCPAKLEGKEKGNLITLITNDIELLEVFYAHTISPIFIALITSVFMLFFLGQIHTHLVLIALLAYSTVGVLMPLYFGVCGGSLGMQLRTGVGALSSMMLESIRGIYEIIQYGNGAQRKAMLSTKARELSKTQEQLSTLEGFQKGLTNLAVLGFSVFLFLYSCLLYQSGQLTLGQVLVATVTLFSSFGPVIALSNLSNNLHQTLASGERVLSLLEESPAVQEVKQGEKLDFEGLQVKNVSFGYAQETIVKDLSLDIPKGKILGIHGASGSGKSTLIKLLMRFWDVHQGTIDVSDTPIQTVETTYLRQLESYVTQEVWLFEDTIKKNIQIAKWDATDDEIFEAARKASIHTFIQSLPNGYDTKLKELGDSLSGGEKQRIGLARAFLHDGAVMLLDEPTSNLDALNEGMILKSLYEAKEGKTILLVSHRASTLRIADNVYQMAFGRMS